MDPIEKQKLTAAELRKMSEAMGDMELDMEIAPYYGYKIPDNSQYARKYHGAKGLPGDVSVTLGGFVVPHDYRERENNSVIDGIPLNVKESPGTINVVHNKTSPHIWAHEIDHATVGEDLSEGSIRLRDAFRAMNEKDWNSAVKMWRDQIGRSTGTFPATKDAEKALIDDMEKNQQWANSGLWEEEYKRGARLPEQKLSDESIKDTLMRLMMPEQREYALDRATQTYYTKHKKRKQEDK